MATPQSPEEPREWLAKRLKKDIPDPLWDELVRDGYDASARRGDKGKELLLKQARILMRRYGRRTSPNEPFRGKLPQIVRDVIPENELLRAEVMSDHWARLANYESDVYWFRAFHLGGTTLSVKGANEFLAAAGKDKRIVQEIKSVCERLTRNYGWDTSQALRFLLVGTPVMIEPVQVEHLQRVNSKWGNSARVTLTFDVWVSLRTITRVVNRLRRMAGQRSKRPIEAKTMFLAELVSGTMFRSGRSQRQLMSDWNLDFPEWAYRDERHFARDCKGAKRKILFMGVGPPDIGPGDEIPGAF